VDRLLGGLVSRSLRRGFAGEPIWLAVALCAWLVRRARKSKAEVVWQGRVGPGQRLVVTTLDPARGGSAPG
jgi:hypothetical protein